MRIISVITIKSNIVQTVHSFAVVDEELSFEVTKEAENLFIETAIGLGFNSETEDSSFILDNGYFEQDDWSVCLTWSFI